MEKMVINKLKKIIEQYQKYTFANATKNLIYHWQTREKRKTFGALNPDKVFYVIRSIDDKNRFYIGPQNHLLANYFYVLSHLRYAQINGWIPIIDMLNYPVYNSLPYPVNGTANAWEYFWQQPSQYTLEEVYQSKNVILSKQNWYKQYDMGYEILNYLDKSTINFYWQIAQAVQLNDITKAFINCEKEKIWRVNSEKDKILGICFRFGGHSLRHYNYGQGHPIQPDEDYIIKIAREKIKKYGINKIFIASDTNEAIEIFKNEFGDRLIFVDRIRYSEKIKNVSENPLYRINQILKTSKYYLLEMELLAICDFLIGSINSGFRYAVIKNNNNYKDIEILNCGFLPDKR